MNKGRDAMIDIETLGTGAGYVVLSIGYLEFDPRGNDDFLSLAGTKRSHTYYLDKDEQLNIGYAVHQDTLDWWSKQSAEAQDRMFNTPANTTLKDCLSKLQELLKNVNDIWSYGPMDNNMLNFMSQRELGSDLFFYRKWNDLRTLTKLMDFKWDEKPAGMVAHDPLHDSVWQALAVQKLMRD